MSLPGHSFGGGSYPSAEVQSVYSTALADYAKKNKENDDYIYLQKIRKGLDKVIGRDRNGMMSRDHPD